MLDPHNLLLHVHPDLVKVIVAASQGAQKFQVVQGLRTLTQEAEAVASGHSTTMHSRHLPNTEGLSCAVDVAALTNSHIDWTSARYPPINAQVQAVARSLHIPVEWGGLWKKPVDLGHFQLPWAQYP